MSKTIKIDWKTVVELKDQQLAGLSALLHTAVALLAVNHTTSEPTSCRVFQETDQFLKDPRIRQMLDTEK